MGRGEGESAPGNGSGPAAAADPIGVARAIALRQLAMAPRTRAQLSLALAKRGVDEDIAHGVLDRFEEVNLVDDEEFARQWVSSRHQGRGLARRALTYELRHRGVDSQTVQEAVQVIDDDAELLAAQTLVRRRLRTLTAVDPDRAARRLLGMLARKGYGPGVAARAVRQVLGETSTELPGLDEADDDGP